MIFILVVKRIGLANPFSTTAMTTSRGECNTPAAKYPNHESMYMTLERARRYLGFILSLIYAIGMDRLSFAAASTAPNSPTIRILSMICSI